MVSLSRRFTLAFLLIVALPSLVVSIILSTLYLSALYSTVERQSEATAREIARNIQNETDSVSLLAAALVHDSTLRSFVDQYARASGSAARLVAAEAIDAKLVSFFDYTSRIGAVVLFFKRGGDYYYSNYPNLRNLDGLGLEVCGGALRDRGKVYLLDTLSGVGGSVGEKSLLSVAVCPDRREGAELAAILVMFRSPYLDDLAAGGGGAAFDAAVFGRSGKALLSSLPPELTSGGPPSRSGELRSKGRAWLATLWPMDSTGWTILLAADKTALSSRITRYQWYLYPALALLALLFFAYVEVFFARIAAPVRDLTRSMRIVGSGDYTVRASPRGIAEFSALTNGFNSMVEEIDGLLAERERLSRERLTAELDALRYQINPHFVANTLNSIRLMALAARAEPIALMTRDLMRVLADSYAEAGALVELGREMQSLASYIGIMKVRFGELFDVSTELEEGTESLLVLRMILQPIVENSILHGFAGREAVGRRGRIEVRSRLIARPDSATPRLGPDRSDEGREPLPDYALAIEVRDDGSGMGEERLKEVLDGCRDGAAARAEERLVAAGRDDVAHRVGLANVAKRIRLEFGEPYGLAVESEPGEGACVRLLLPALRRAKPPDAAGRPAAERADA